MSTQIETAWVNQFSSNVVHLAQQRTSRLRACVRVEPLNGEYGYFDQIGSVEMVERTSRHADTPSTEVPHSRRRVEMADWEAADLIDSQDVQRMLTNPQSRYTEAFAAGEGRRIDRTIIAGFFAAAATGKTGSTSVSFPSGNQVAVDYVESGSAVNSFITIAKLRRGVELLDAGEAGTGDQGQAMEERFIYLSAKQKAKLLATTEVTSSDYNTVKALVQGEIDTFMGLKFVRGELFATDASGYERVPIWVKSGMLLAEGQTGVTRAAEDPTKGFNVRVYRKASYGATRMEEPKVIEIKCLRA